MSGWIECVYLRSGFQNRVWETGKQYATNKHIQDSDIKSLQLRKTIC